MHTAVHGQADLPEADWLIRELSLLPHPEGGFYRETYRSPTLDHRGRSAATMIYFLLLQGHVSRLHRLDASTSFRPGVGSVRPRPLAPPTRWWAAALHRDSSSRVSSSVNGRA